MARLTRRGFVTASSALAAAPALAALAARAQGPAAPDTGNLRVEKDIVFGKAGSMDLKLDVYQPPAGVTPKRMAIIHLFGGGFFVGNKNAGYIINDAKALGARGYTNISANYRLQTQGSWPAQIHDVKAAIRWTRANAARLGIERQQDRRRRVLGRRHALADGGRHERQEGVRGRRRQRRRQLRRQRLHRRLSAGERADRRRPLSRRARRRPRTSPRHRRRPTSAPRSRRRSSFTAPRTGRSRCSRASISSPSSMRLGVPIDADADPGRRPCVRQQRPRRRRGDGGIDRSLPRSADHQSEAVSLVRWRRRRRGAAAAGGEPPQVGAPQRRAAAASSQRFHVPGSMFRVRFRVRGSAAATGKPIGGTLTPRDSRRAWI